MTAATFEVLHVDARTGEVITALPVTGIGFAETLNAEGSASVGIPLSAPEADPEILTPVGSGLVVLRDGEPVWGGILWTLAADLASGVLTLNASGYHSYYKSVALVAGYERRADPAHLLRDWIETRNETNGIGTDTSRITTTGGFRSRNWTRYEHKNVAEAIEELAEDAGGFNFRYEPYWLERGQRIGHRFLKTLRSGMQIPSALVHRENCNVTQVTYDSTALATHTYAVGADNGNGTKLLATANNNHIGLAYRMPNKHVVKTFSDVKDSATLQDKANALAAIGSAPIAIPSLTLYPGEFAPGDFTPGNSCAVEVQQGYVNLAGDFVVTECRTSVDVNGTEVITLSLAHKGLFTYGDAS